MKREKSARAFPLFIIMLVMGFLQVVATMLVASITPASTSYVMWMIVGCFVLFGGATLFYREHKVEKKYDTLIEQEDRERERQLQEQASHQH